MKQLAPISTPPQADRLTCDSVVFKATICRLYLVPTVQAVAGTFTMRQARLLIGLSLLVVSTAEDLTKHVDVL